MLKFGAVVCFCRLRPVYVISDDLNSVELGIFQALAELTLNARLVLFSDENLAYITAFMIILEWIDIFQIRYYGMRYNATDERCNSSL